MSEFDPKLIPVEVIDTASPEAVAAIPPLKKSPDESPFPFQGMTKVRVDALSVEQRQAIKENIIKQQKQQKQDLINGIHPDILSSDEEGEADEQRKKKDEETKALHKLLNQEFCGDCDPDESHLAPIHRVIIPSDVTTINPDDDYIEVVGTRDGKVTVIANLEPYAKNLNTLILRSCLLSTMAGVENLVHLEKLELYDNYLQGITHIQSLNKLKILDLSFNSIRFIPELASSCPLLEELYVAQNKLKKIEGLEGLVHLKTLDLGANRIRVIEGLDSLKSLRSLWLGKNKIEKVQGLEKLVTLEQLDIQNNRLTSLGDGLQTLVNLRELYLACNRLPDPKGLPPPGCLNTVDFSYNLMKSLEGIEPYTTLEDLWVSGSVLENFDQVKPLLPLKNLTTLYLEQSPLSREFEYRMKLTELIPSLDTLDGIYVNRKKK